MNSRGELRAADGRKVAWSCMTADGASGTVTVDGRQFDLAQGGVFVVTTRGGEAKVEQIAVDMARLQGGPVPQQLRRLAETEPRVAALFKQAQGAK